MTAPDSPISRRRQSNLLDSMGSIGFPRSLSEGRLSSAASRLEELLPGMDWTAPSRHVISQVTRGVLTGVAVTCIFLGLCLMVLQLTPSYSGTRAHISGKIHLHAFNPMAALKAYGSENNTIATLGNPPYRNFVLDGMSVVANHTDLKAAFVYLLHKDDGDLLLTSLLVLRERFLKTYPYPVLVFHDEGMTDERLAQLQQQIPYGVQVYFVLLNDFNTFPPGFNSSVTWQDVATDEWWPWYSHMIRFWSRQVFHHPVIRQLDFFARLDADSFLTTDIQYDIFKYMYLNDYAYGYVQQWWADNRFAVGFFDFVEGYILEHGDEAALAEKNGVWIPPKDERIKYAPKTFFNNFEVVHIPRIINDPGIMAFMDAVDITLNMYMDQWSEGMIRFHALGIYLDFDKEVKHLCEIGYYHTRRVPRTC